MSALPVTLDKRRHLLEAAVRVFARKGFHASRVGDIAVEAGAAHGLLYHYFSSKDELLETIFRETWSSLLESLNGIYERGGSVHDQLRRVAAVVLGSWKQDPDLIRVLVREVTRSPQLQREVGEIEQALGALARIVERGQQNGELRSEIDPLIAATVVYGALEEVLTSWVLGQLPDRQEDVARAVETVVGVLTAGLMVSREGKGG